MRIVQAFVLQYDDYDNQSSILDWLLTPIYLKRARPFDTLVLYTNKASINKLSNLWPFIKNNYDEVIDDIKVDITKIFSAPKFIAMKNELNNFGTDFIIIDNDLYAFNNFLSTINDFCVYFAEPHLLPWYKYIVNNEYNKLNAPSWIKWTAIPYNCATIRINNNKILQEYIKLFNTIKAENLSYNRPEKAVIKEQWSLGELFKKYNITPLYIREQHNSFHKGDLKTKFKPKTLIKIQEYLLFWLYPSAYKEYLNYFKLTNILYSSNIKEIFKDIPKDIKDNLLAPINKKFIIK